MQKYGRDWQAKENIEEVRKSIYAKLGVPYPSRKKKRKSAKNIFLQSPEWKASRKRVLELYGRICMKCGSTAHICVDHIKPRSLYPALGLEFDNMQVLCWKCNKVKGTTDMTDYRPKVPKMH